MLSCSIWLSAPSFWKGGGLESHCIGRVCSADVAVARQHPQRDVNKITLLHQAGISNHFMRKMHGQTTPLYLLLIQSD